MCGPFDGGLKGVGCFVRAICWGTKGNGLLCEGHLMGD